MRLVAHWNNRIKANISISVNIKGYGEKEDVKSFYEWIGKPKMYTYYEGLSRDEVPERALIEDLDNDEISDLSYWLFGKKSNLIVNNDNNDDNDDNHDNGICRSSCFVRIIIACHRGCSWRKRTVCGGCVMEKQSEKNRKTIFT